MTLLPGIVANWHKQFVDRLVANGVSPVIAQSWLDCEMDKFDYAVDPGDSAVGELRYICEACGVRY